MASGTQSHAGKTRANGHRMVERAAPAPKHLATPTDLTSQETQAITEALNPLVANLFALYVKTKNFHWHLSGTHFRDYHLLFDEQAEQIFDAIDELAERVRKVGGTTIRSVSHISQLQTLADDNETYVPALEMVRRLMDDNSALVRAMRDAHEVCERCRDVASTSLLEQFIDEAERRTWFLYEVTQGKESGKPS